MKVMKVTCWAMVAMPTLRGERLQDAITLAVEVSDDVQDAYDVLLAADACKTDGAADEFKDTCYDSFVEKTKEIKNRSLMAKYVTDVVKHVGYEVQDDASLEAFVRYFDDECDGDLSYDRLESGIRIAAAENCNGNNWLTPATSDADPGDGTSLGQLRDTVLFSSADKTLLRDARAAIQNVRRGGNPYDENKRKAGIKDFTLQCLGVAGLSVDKTDLETFVTTIFGKADTNQKYSKFLDELKTFLKDGRTVKDDQGTEVAAGDLDTKLGALEMNDDKTFDSVKNSIPEMSMYIYHVAEELEMHILNYGDLLGLAPWYTTTTGCDHYGSSTAVDLMDELNKCAALLEESENPVAYRCGGWIQKDSYS